MAFRIAGSMVLKNALAGAKPVLLEPMMRLEVVVPDEMLGEVIADLTSRRGKIFGMEPTSKGTLIHAQAPHAELRRTAEQGKDEPKPTQPGKGRAWRSEIRGHNP